MSPRRRRPALLLAALILGTPAAARAEVVHITIDGLAFQPSQASVRAGDTVEWTNDDFIDHTATAVSGAWDVVIPAGASGRVVVTHPGTVRYYCRYHPNMVGELRVQAK